MPILLALASGLVYGVADYGGGRAARVHPAALVALMGQLASFVLVAAAVAVMGSPWPSAPTMAWGGFGGLAGAIGIACLYHAFAHGAMSVVAPVAAVVGALLPVVVGVASGERPSSLSAVGIVLAVSSVALVAGVVGERERPTSPEILGFAVGAGVCFGLLFVAFGRADHDSGMWPLLAARIVSVPALILLCVALRTRPGRPRSVLWLAVGTGVLDMGSNALYIAAARLGPLSEVAVVSSLYPASTVLLAFTIDGERVDRWQAVGLGLAVLALVAVTLGRA